MRSTVGRRTPRSVERLHAALSEVDDVVAEVRRTAESIDESPERLEAIRERRQLLKNLCRKYGDDLGGGDGVPRRDAGTASTSWSSSTPGPQRSTGSANRRSPTSSPRRGWSARHGERRRRSWRRRCSRRCASWPCRTPRSPCRSATTTATIRATSVSFLLAANPGSPLLPLTRVASGGELARTMLALRLTLTGGAAPGLTLVFDEVDAGIGGTAATAVGAALARLGADAQVLVVTHLAQVAALAGHAVRRRQVGAQGRARASRRRRSVGERAGRPRSPACCRAVRLGVGPAARSGAVVVSIRRSPSVVRSRGVG